MRLLTNFTQLGLICRGTAAGAHPPVDDITVEMLREIYRIEARIEKCSRCFDHVIVDSKAA
ncbi:MAG: hypothetical protein WD005_06020 [Haliea sp.]